MPEIGKVINYDIDIKPSHNKGFIVKIGCGHFAFESVRTMLDALELYLSNTGKWEKMYASEISSTGEEPERVPRPAPNLGMTVENH